MPMNDSINHILEFDGDSCVRASAGTGKTFLLVEKFLHSLKKKKEGGNFYRLENILAITFTEKAADEMRQRISQNILSHLKTIEQTKTNREGRQLAQHLRNCRRVMAQAWISTIHSFCARILSENPIEAGIDPRFQIMDASASSEMLERELERFLLKKIHAGNRPALDLAYRYGFGSDFAYESSLKKIIAHLSPLIRAEALQPRRILSGYDSLQNSLGELLARFKQDADHALANIAPHVKTATAIKAFEELKSELPAMPSVKIESKKDALKLAQKLRATAGKLRFKNEEAKDGVAKLKDALQNYAGCMISSLAHKSAGQLCGLMEEFNNHLSRKVKNLALLDFDDLQERTLYLFSRHPATLERYREKFARVMVDEFQDVNNLQKEIIYRLAKSGEGKLFIVGDPKQAIYGFRGGDVEVFNEAQKEIVKSTNGKGIFHLRTNYRSGKNLVEFANHYFRQNGSGIFCEEDTCKTSRDTNDTPMVENLTFSAGELSADDARFKEARLIAMRISEMTKRKNGLSRRIKHGDMVILFRKFTALPLYEAALNVARVPYAIHRGAGFYQSQEVADLLSLLSYIDNPSDIVSWFGALRSPYAGCSDETILNLRLDAHGKIINPLIYLGEAIAPSGVGDTLERAKFAEFMGWAKKLLSIKDRMGVSELIETVLEKSRITGVLGSQPNGFQKVANVLKLIETARTMEQDTFSTLKNFVRRMMDMAENAPLEPQAVVTAPDEDVVTMMTVHQSKGLEFPVVFLADINSAGAGARLPVIFNKQKGLAIKYVDKTTLTSHAGRLFDQASALNKEKEAADEERLFYVAVTRARDHLVLSGSWKGEKGFKRVETLLRLREKQPRLFADNPPPELTFQQTAPGKTVYDILKGNVRTGETATAEIKTQTATNAVGEAAIGVSGLTAFRRCPREYLFRQLYGISPEKTGVADSSAPVAEQGRAVHAALENVDFGLDRKSFKKSLDVAIKTNLIESGKEEKNNIRQNIASLYDVNPFKKLRTGELKIVGKEIPFKAKYGTKQNACLINGRIDLLLRGAEEVWVVDYKYSRAGKADASARFQAGLYGLAIAGHLKFDKVSCAVAYIKGSTPRVIEFKLNRKRLEKQVVETAGRIMEWEEKARRFSDGMAELPNVKCPDRFCGFQQFCLQG